MSRGTTRVAYHHVFLPAVQYALMSSYIPKESLDSVQANAIRKVLNWDGIQPRHAQSKGVSTKTSRRHGIPEIVQHTRGQEHNPISEACQSRLHGWMTVQNRSRLGPAMGRHRHCGDGDTISRNTMNDRQVSGIHQGVFNRMQGSDSDGRQAKDPKRE